MKLYTPKHQNESIVLEKIINNKEMSRSKISQLTNLTKSSISDITKTLMESALIYEGRTGTSSTTGGRKPIYLNFNGHCATAIAIEIGKDYVKSFFSYINGEIIKTVNYPNIEIHKDNIIPIIKKVISQLKNNNAATEYGIVGIAIAIHGSISNNKILFTPYSNLDELSLHEKLSTEIGFPILLINEANSAALGEYTFTSSFENLISLSIRDGIGAGIVRNGKLYTGKNGNAGEIGHSILFPNGKLCPCGNRGCLEQYASNTILKQKFANNKKIDMVENSTIIDLWNRNDTEAIRILKKNAYFLSVGINNIVLMYDPEVIVINNDLYQQLPALVDEIKKQLTGRNSKSIIIQNTSLLGNSTLLGCISLVAQYFLHINKLKFSIN